jgi:hypothetical protein
MSVVVAAAQAAFELTTKETTHSDPPVVPRESCRASQFVPLMWRATVSSGEKQCITTYMPVSRTIVSMTVVACQVHHPLLINLCCLNGPLGLSPTTEPAATLAKTYIFLRCVLRRLPHTALLPVNLLPRRFVPAGDTPKANGCCLISALYGSAFKASSVGNPWPAADRCWRLAMAQVQQAGFVLRQVRQNRR